MTWLWIFVGICPLALLVLVGFAAHIDPLSGRLRSRQRLRARREAAGALHADVIACTE
jgi:hypothetical protein